MARAIAVESGVLLRNEGGLPLRSGSIGVIGATGGQAAVGPGNGRAYGFEVREISPLDALRRYGVKADYAVGGDQTGVAIPTAVLRTPGGAPGLERRMGAATSVDATLDFRRSAALPAKTDAVWTTTLTVPESGRYTLMTQSWGGSAVLKLNGQHIASSAKVPFHGKPKKWTSLLPTTQGLDNGQSDQMLEAGKNYTLTIEALGDTPDPVEIRLAWITPQMRRDNRAVAVALARRVATPVVFAWAKSGELSDPAENLLLPDEQNEMIEAVAAANPNTVVVLNTGGPVRMPWAGKVKAILEMWFPGQEGGWATADLLLDKANPSGKLPITFPQRYEDTPLMEPGHAERYQPVNNAITYTEGLLVGYRWYDTKGIKPLYAFGHGLSYTSFRYSALKAVPEGDGADVSFTVTNTGKVAGAETAQVYLARPAAAPVPMPAKALAGFEKVMLAPGASTTVTVHLAGALFPIGLSRTRAGNASPGHAPCRWAAPRMRPCWRGRSVRGTDLPANGRGAWPAPCSPFVSGLLKAGAQRPRLSLSILLGFVDRFTARRIAGIAEILAGIFALLPAMVGEIIDMRVGKDRRIAPGKLHIEHLPVLAQFIAFHQMRAGPAHAPAGDRAIAHLVEAHRVDHQYRSFPMADGMAVGGRIEAVGVGMLAAVQIDMPCRGLHFGGDGQLLLALNQIQRRGIAHDEGRAERMTPARSHQHQVVELRLGDGMLIGRGQIRLAHMLAVLTQLPEAGKVRHGGSGRGRHHGQRQHGSQRGGQLIST
jgi:hypothetical protein